MSKKLLCLISFILVLGVTTVSSADLDDDPNLVAWWKFDGDTLDSSGNERHATLVGDAHLVDEGILGGALSVDGSGDYATVPGYTGINADRSDPANPTQRAFTVACWILWQGNGSLVNWGSSDTTGVGGQYQNFRVDGGRLRAEHGNGRFRGATMVNDGEWHHVAMVVSDGANIEPPATQLYVDGKKDPQGADTVNAQNIWNLTEDAEVGIGVRASHTDRFFDGMFDDVRIYDRVLSQGEIRVLMGLLSAYEPDPVDGALVEDVSVLLGWTPGIQAVEHDVYVGTAADLGADQLLGRVATATALATGLEKDTTYYWRVDDITVDGTVITGEVWSFWVPPRSAYSPSPADGVKLLDATATLSWAGGFTPILHNVNFGTDPAALTPVSMMQPDATYDTGPLEPGTTYYWRIDEFYGIDTVEGPVWSFSTVPILPKSDDPNLVALWTFDGDSGGVVLDQSGNANHVLLRDGAQVVAGHGGDVLDLGLTGNGAISNLVYDDVNAELPEVSVMAWIRTDSDAAQYILSFDRDENYRLAVGATNAPVGPGQVGWHVMTIQDGAEMMADYGSVTRVDDGEWHHVAGVFDNGTLTIYIDGFAEPSATGGPVFGTSTQTRYGFIGANSEATSFPAGTSGGTPLQGEMDDLAIYDRAFSEDEMRQVFGDVAIAWQPEPELGATVDVVGVVLSWTAGDGAAEHDVYLGTDAAAVAAADASVSLGRQADTSLAIAGVLEFDSTYYWRVDEVAADGTVSAGRVWTFSTAADLTIYDTTTPFDYDTSVDPFTSDISLDLDPAQNWTDPIGRLAVNYTGQAAPGSVTVDEAAGTTTVVGRGADIWGSSDEFQYAYTMITGNGSMTVKVDSFANTHDWSQAGIMIRETLDAGSAFARVTLTGTDGVYFNTRAMPNQDATDASGARSAEAQAATAPVWIKIERTFPMVNASYSTDGVTFVPLGGPAVVPMSPAPIYIGLAVTSRSGAETYATAVFSEITSDGGVVAGPLSSAEIGLTGNAAAPMSLVLTDASGASDAVVNPDPAAVNQTSATDFVVDLADYNIDLTAVVRATLVIGDGTPGGSGSLTFNNVRLLGFKPPVGHWPLADGAGAIAVDLSASGNNGTINNPNGGLGPDGSVWVDDPERGTVISFNGTADGAFVRAGEIPQMTLTNDFTWAFWAKQDAGNTTPNDIIFGNRKDENAVDFVPRQFIKFTPTKFEWHMNDNGDDNLEYDDIPADVWLHHAVVKAGDQLTYYRNGIEASSGTITQALDFPQPLFFGGDNENAEGENWRGFMSDARIYDRALSDAEIAKLAGL